MSDTAATGNTPPPPARTTAYGYYVVGVLMVAYTISFLDRMALSLLIDPVRKSFGLTDTEVSLLAGMAFAIFFAVCAFPFGRWVDTRERRGVVVLGMSLWSLATIACGFATDFWKLFAARMGVGVGEASLNPAAYSLIPDYFPPERRGLAMSIYYCGVTLGGGLAMLAGGLIVEALTEARGALPIVGDMEPWRVVFIVAGLPGLLVALLVLLTVREPRRAAPKAAQANAPKISEVFGAIGRDWRVFLPIFAGFCGFAINGYGFQVWGPTYFMRLHGMSPGEVGMLFGIGFGVAGTLGLLTGGVWSDWLVRKGHIDAPIRVGLWSAWLQAPFFVIAYLSPSLSLAAPLFVCGMFGASIVGGLQGAMVQSLTPPRMRGMMAAVYGASVTIAGLAVAPTLTAAMSDYVFGGDQGLGKALAVTSVVSLSACTILLIIGLPAARRRATMILEQEHAAAG